jgi:hypothetical protein
MQAAAVPCNEKRLGKHSTTSEKNTPERLEEHSVALLHTDMLRAAEARLTSANAPAAALAGREIGEVSNRRGKSPCHHPLPPPLPPVPKKPKPI